MTVIYCKKCLQRQFSIMDKKYAQMFSQCWTCDKVEWEQGRLGLELFEKRETEALNNVIK